MYKQEEKQEQSIQYKHPDYIEFEPIWNQCKDAIVKGQRAIKEAGVKYLPMTEGQEADYIQGGKKLLSAQNRYNKYKTKAIYYNYPKETKTKAISMMTRKDTVFNLLENEKLKAVETNFLVSGESAQAAYKEMCEQVFTYGRVGLLVDMPSMEDAISIIAEEGDIIPRGVIYDTFSILDWNHIKSNQNSKISFILLNESRNLFNKETKTRVFTPRYRLLALSPEGFYYSKSLDPEEYSEWNFDDPDIKDSDIPKFGGKPLNYIPFYIANVTDMGTKIEHPPLEELTDLSIAIYRKEADYGELQYKQSFSILAITGTDVEGIGVNTDGVFVDSNPDTKVYYAGVNGEGLSSQRLAIEDLKGEAKRLSINVLDKNGVENVNAIRTRISMETSNLDNIGATVANTMQAAFKTIALSVDINDVSEITVLNNTDYDVSTLIPAEMNDEWNLVKSGGMSKRDFHAQMVKNEYTTNLVFEDWLLELEPEPKPKEETKIETVVNVDDETTITEE